MTPEILSASIRLLVARMFKANFENLRGPRGEPGADGRSGADGSPGIDGAPGQDGSRGPKGERGERGSPGERGPQGVKGEPGMPGRDGLPGPKGEQGEPGKDGKDADLEDLKLTWLGSFNPLPSGGAAGQVLGKVSNYERDVGWVDQTGTGGGQGPPGPQGPAGANGAPGAAGPQGPPGPMVPVGGIIVWSGSVASVPSNWAVCNGMANAPGPDLRAYFLV